MLLWPLVVLLLAMPESSVSDDAICRPPPHEFLPDTNVYVCPPAASGGVSSDWRGPSYSKYAGDISYGVSDSRYYSAHGYVSFDLAGFPDSATAVSARLWYYQYYHGISISSHDPPYTSVVLIPDVNAPAQQLFQDISSGAIVDARVYTEDGWVVRSFNSAGLAAVDSCIRAADAIDIGINGGGCPPGAAYGAGPYDPLRAYLEIRYSTAASYCDVVAIEALFGSNLYTLDDSIVAFSRFRNTGNHAARGFPILTSLNGVVDTVDVDSLAPNETLRIRAAFPPQTAPGSVKVMACSRVPSDWCPHNDTAAATAYVFPHGTRSAETFEPEYSPSFPPDGWIACHGGNPTGWQRVGPPNRYAHSGIYQAYSASGDPPDDWLITFGLAPAAGSADTVGVFFRDYLQVWALGSQNPYDPLAMLLDTAYESTNWCEARLSLDEYDGRTVYVGFRRYNADAKGAALDDIWFTSERAAAVEEPTKGPTPGLRLSIGQNPVTGNSVVIRYQTPKAGPLLVEVISASGRVVARQRLEMALGGGQVVFRAGTWPSGVYFFRVKAGASFATAKCAVQRRR